MVVIKGQFEPIYKGGISFDPSGPGINGNMWLDTSTNILYMHDNVRGKWLSANRNYIEFVRNGVSDGMYMPIIGDLDSEVDYFTPGKDSTITAVYCKSRGGAADKTFIIYKNDVNVFEFLYTGSDREYTNNSVDVDVNKDDRVRLYVTEYGGPTKAPFCRIEYAWRYVP